MLIRFFRRDSPYGFLLLPILVLVLWPGAGAGGAGLMAAGTGISLQVVAGMPLYAPFRWMLGFSPWAALLLSFVLLLGLAHRLNRVANDSELFERRSHLPILLLPLLLALLPFGLVPGPAFVGMWAVIWAMGRTWTSMGRKSVLSALFDAGLLLGIAGVFYLPYTFLIVVLWATLAVNRPFAWRDYVLPGVGMAAMLVLGWGAVHFIDPHAWNPVASMHFAPETPAPPEVHWMYRVILLAVLAMLAVSVVLAFATVYGRSVMREKNIRAAFLAFAFAMSLLALFAWLLDHRVPPVLLAVPGSLLLTYPLLQARKTAWAETAVWILVLLACWARWAP